MTTLNITKATLLTGRSGCDRIVLETTLPSGVYPYTGTAPLELVVANGVGRIYLKDHFPDLETEVIDLDRTKKHIELTEVKQ